MPQAIGRFEVVRELGKGAQGTVYLAQDTRLDRQVAIKTLHTGADNMEALLKEARIVSRLQHPNIVTLFDAGEHEHAPYLVYAYVEGQTLERLLRTEKTLSMARAAQIVCGILKGIGYAHQQGVMHLDLKPANIMITSNDQPLVMDFGIARTMTQQSIKESKINGTPQYIAPEIILGKNVTPSADLFSLGMILYELVTGKPAVDGNNVYEILHKNVNVAAESPSARNINVDERLEAIILKAIAKKPENRYANAATMLQALRDYLDPAHEKSQAIHDETHSTLEFLLRRMRSKSDFPTLSSTISEINKTVDDESGSANMLTKIILQDFALTNKLLKLVNTVSYSQFGGKINTISKAVVILGFETVRNIAMSLILLDFLQNKAQASQLKDDVVSSFFAGVVAAQLSASRNVNDIEEAMICSMFRNLGKLLATFYFFEESQEVIRLMEQGESEDKAALKVLGVTYSDLGIGIAKSWNFPERLLAGMQKLAGEKIKKPRGELETLTVTVNLANDLCAIAGSTNVAEKPGALKQLSKRYENAITVSEQQLGKALESGLKELAIRAKIHGIDTEQSPLIKNISAWSGVRVEEEGAAAAEGSTVIAKEGAAAAEGGTVIAKEDAAAAEGRLVTTGESTATAEPDSMAGITQLGMNHAQTGEGIRIDPEAILSAGIQDVTDTLVDDYKLNDVLQMVLETIHRGMSFNRTLICVRDAKNNQMVARFGFGKDSDAVLLKFRFPLAFAPDVFHLAMDKGVDIVIEDVTAQNIAAKIPMWYRDAVTAQSFLLLPVMIRDKAIGLFYADMEQANGLQVSQKQLSLLRTLRNQAVLAIKQKM